MAPTYAQTAFQVYYDDVAIVDASQFVRDTEPSPLGINVDYLMDDDANRPATPTRSTTQALIDLGAGFLRYPGGEKSDSHLWSVSPYSASVPTLARTGPLEWPSSDPKIMMPDGVTFKINPLNFDEFIAMANSVGAEPIIVVCFDAMYAAATSGGTAPSKATLKTAAVEWVRYANITQGYGVKYWELGNESYLGGMNGAPTVAQYTTDFIEFATAMKVVDPTIKVGANGGQNAWWQHVLTNAATHIDYLSVHDYPAFGWQSYEFYRTNSFGLPEVQRAKDMLLAHAPSHYNRIEILVTETNTHDWSGAGSWPHINNTGHAISLFDVLGQMIVDSKVVTGTVWTTHWVENNAPIASLTLHDLLKNDNTFYPTGLATAIWANLYDKMVATTNPALAFVRSYATYNTSTGSLRIFLINKDGTAQNSQVRLANYTPSGSAVTRKVFKGTSPADESPTWLNDTNVTVSNNVIHLMLPAYSISMLTVSGSI